MPEIRLRESDQASIRQLFRTGLESDGSLLPRAALLAVARPIPCDAIVVGEVDPEGYLVSTSSAVPADANADAGPRVCEGPLPTVLQHVGAPPPHQGGAVPCPRCGVKDSLRVGFCPAGSRNVIQLTLDRAHAVFSDRDVAMLAMLQPALDCILLTHPRSSTPPCLSNAERRVLELVAEGRSNQEVAIRLCVTVATVRRHLEHVCSKLGVTNRTAAVAQVTDKPGSDG